MSAFHIEDRVRRLLLLGVWEDWPIFPSLFLIGLHLNGQTTRILNSLRTLSSIALRRSNATLMREEATNL